MRKLIDLILSRKKLTALILLIVLMMGIFFWRQAHAASTAIKTTTVKRGEITKTVSASGKVVSDQEVVLKFQTSGLLTWVGVKEGDHVNAWQAIAQLDTRELQKNLEKALRDYSKERNDWDQDKQITYKDQAITDTAKRILEKNNWDLDKAVLDVELKDIALKFASLVTPISGIVTQVDTSVAGVNITPAAATFTVSNPDKMIFRANIDEADIAGLAIGLSAKISLDAYPDQEFKGKITKVGFASVTTSGGGTAFSAEITLPANDNLKFKSGMNGDTDIEIEKKTDILIVPSSVMMTKNGQDYVYKSQNGQYLKTKVTIGLQDDKNTEILSGLSEKEKIVNDPVFLKNEANK